MRLLSFTTLNLSYIGTVSEKPRSSATPEDTQSLAILHNPPDHGGIRTERSLAAEPVQGPFRNQAASSQEATSLDRLHPSDNSSSGSERPGWPALALSRRDSWLNQA